MKKSQTHDTPQAVGGADETDLGLRLGASSITEAWVDPTNWRSQLDDLAAGLSRRLVSSGGRPTDPNWTVSRRVPFAAETWALLQQLADSIGTDGKSVAPAQLAATIVEERVAQIDKAIRQTKKRQPN